MINNKDEIYADMPEMLEIHEASGEFCTEDRIVALLYRLMRDELSTGVIEGHVQQILAKSEPGKEICFTNGWLAQYAENIVERLAANTDEA